MAGQAVGSGVIRGKGGFMPLHCTAHLGGTDSTARTHLE